MRLTKNLGIASAAIALTFAAVGTKPAEAAFVGAYDPSNWTLVNRNADGFVSITGSPEAIQLYGGNNGSISNGTTDLIVKAVADGVVSFKWNYSTADAAGFYDPFSFVKNGEPTNIFAGLLTTGQGTYSTTVAAGDLFSFRVATAENFNGRGNVTISDFSAPVPEPFTVGGSALALGFGSWLKRKQLVASKKA